MTGGRRTTPAAYRLLHQGTLALAEIEHAGVRVDRDYLDGAVARMHGEVAELERSMAADATVYAAWRRAWGAKTNLGSRTQISDVFFNRLGYAAGEMTTGGRTGRGEIRARANRTNLEKVDHPFVKLFLRAEAIKKAVSTNLEGIRREMVRHADGGYYVHPSYGLNVPRSLRSSCSMPNFQNNPVRDPEIAALVRPCYTARPGNHFVEVDYGQLEVRVPYTYNGDVALLHGITSGDMHREAACDIFLLRPEQVDKKTTRHVAKNKWVFPQFFGDWYASCAPNIWDTVVRGDWKTADGKTRILDHLRARGITELGECDPDRVVKRGTTPGTFVHHLKKCQEKLWERFRVYAKWKRDFYDEYRRAGGFMLHTGFWIRGPLAKNEVVNYPIQGAAFHCLLRSLVLLLTEIRRLKLKTLVVGEIHDSVQLDVPPRELNTILTLTREVMTERVPAEWAWINCPLVTEAEVSDVGKSWYDKGEWVESGGVWGPKS